VKTPDLGEEILCELRALRQDVARLENDVLLTEGEAATMRGASVHTLRRERHEGRGPEFVRDPKTNAIRYRRSDIRRYVSANIVRPRKSSEPDFEAVTQ